MILAIFARIGQAIKWFFSLPINESQELQYLKLLLEEERRAREERERLIFQYFGMYRGLQPMSAAQHVPVAIKNDRQSVRRVALESEMKSKRDYWVDRQAKVEAEIENARLQSISEGGNKDGGKIQQSEAG